MSNEKAPYNQADVAQSMGQDWVMMQQSPWDAINNQPAVNSSVTKESGYNQAVVAESMGQDWVMMQQNPLPDKGSSNYKDPSFESPFTQADVAISMGQPGFGLDGKMFDESGFSFSFKNLGTALIPVVGIPMLTQHISFCTTYCKSIGRGGEKAAMDECLQNFKGIKNGSYKMTPASPAITPPEVSTDASGNVVSTDASGKTSIFPAPAPAPASKTWIWVVVAVVLLLIIIGVIMYMRHKNAAVKA